jgi:hypothetical protein
MKITPKEFFTNYIIDPTSDDLSKRQKTLFVVLAILLFPVTIGVFAWSKFRNIKAVHPSNDKITASINAVSFSVLNSTGKVPFTLRDVPQICNERFIKKRYSQPLPDVDKVTVPLKNENTGKTEWVLWKDLTLDQKIAVNNEGMAHDKLPLDTTEEKVNKQFFTYEGQRNFFEGDPREHHGSDHCARAAILSGVFAYLYQKYHPEYSVTPGDIALCQIVAAGHDTGRQSEGPDVYDDASAEFSQQELRELGVTDQQILNDCHSAIADKDNLQFKTKCLIAKCVQNADCAEFRPRLYMKSPKQEKSDFDNSRGYLDIFKELNAFAKEKNAANPGQATLKEGRTYAQFEEELDVLRVEMNDFIFSTHKKEFRQKAVDSGDYYGTVINYLTPKEFPVLSAVLKQTGIRQ